MSDVGRMGMVVSTGATHIRNGAGVIAAGLMLAAIGMWRWRAAGVARIKKREDYYKALEAELQSIEKFNLLQNAAFVGEMKK
jgi:hypothetical protein